MKSKINKEELHTIFAGIANNNEKSFNELYEKYQSLVYGVAFSILKNKENSEDIIQKVFLKIWNMDKSNLPQKCEATWLYKLTKNETLDFLKSAKNEQSLDDIYEASSENDEISEIINQDAYNRIIKKLSKKEQEIVSLKILANFSFKQISQVLNIPISTVKWKYYKSMHTLRILLGNLAAFIVTLVTGLNMLLLNKKKQGNALDKLDGNDITQENHNTENQKEDSLNETIRDEIENQINQETNQEISIPEPSQVDTFDYYGIGLLSFSAIFLILTIIFTIFLTKHQLKLKKKSSK